jgi:hypothetical protein
MLIGGKENSASVELYNWETSVQCRLPDLPQGFAKLAGAVLDGVPIVCGSNKNCFEFSSKVKNWLRVSIQWYFYIKHLMCTFLFCGGLFSSFSFLIHPLYRNLEWGLMFEPRSS